MLAWLNRNAAAVQAIASVVSVLITFALVWITSRYVSLTQQLAGAAREQIRIQRQSAVSEVAHLITLIDVFLGTLHELSRASHAEGLSEVPVWKRSDVMALAALAASVVGAEAPVRECIQSLNWLREKLEQVHQSEGDEASSVMASPQWRQEVGQARNSLRAVRQLAEAVQTSLVQDATAEGATGQPGP